MLTLFSLVLAILIFFSSCEVFTLFGPLVCVGIFAIALWIAKPWFVIKYALIVSIVATVIALWLPSNAFCPEAVQQSIQCTNNLHQIGLALNNYKQTYQTLPPPFVADANGKPMHSWRVLILPFMEQKKLYSQYDFNEPWDGPNNHKLLDARPSAYVCPANRTARTKGNSQSSYLAIVGTNAAWGNMPNSENNDERQRLAAESILVAETFGAGIAWTEPRDISLDDLQTARASADAPKVGSRHGCYRRGMFYDYESNVPYLTNVLAADGHRHYLSSYAIVSDKLPDILQVGRFNEKEVEQLRGYRKAQTTAKLRWHTVAALAVLIVATIMLMFLAVRKKASLTTALELERELAGGKLPPG